ncbi:MAG: hypothetical protein K2N35_13565 [Muribaculaceae bacterium]|nr:hypothetical protein [Muribaculaceae bacterium]
MKKNTFEKRFGILSPIREINANRHSKPHPKHFFTSQYYVLISLSIFMIILSGCEENEFDKTLQSTEEYRSDNQTSTRSNDNGFWESWDYITINNGTKVFTPWNTNCSSSIPVDIATDIKYEDGWDIIFPLTEEEMIQNGERDSPYLIFHNRYTGILKGFSYLLYTFFPNNNGIWQIDSSSPTSLFAFQNTPISKISEKTQNTYFVNNLTTNVTRGFTQGWNCFQLELAYDPTQNGKLTITTFALNKAQISLSGSLNTETNGYITTSDNKNNYSGGFAKLAGNEAKKWIAKQIENQIISSVVSEAVGAIVSGGVGKIIGALTGIFKKNDESSAKSLQLTTNGTISLEGDLEFRATIGINSFTLDINPNRIGYLGVWGLKEEPTLLFSPYAVLKSPQEYSTGYSREYRVTIANASQRASVAINPKATKNVKSTKITTDYYQADKYTRRNTLGRYGSYARDPQKQKKVYNKPFDLKENEIDAFGNLYSPNYYIIADVPFLGNENEYLSIDQFEAPMEVFIPNVPNGPQGARPDLTYNSSFVASVGIVITLPDGTEAHSYHQCIPKIDWNLSEYNNGLYWYLYPCEPVTQLNSGINLRPLNGLDRQLIQLDNQINGPKK